SNALIIRTPLGAALHTADWKIDLEPVIGPPTDEAKLRALGDAGVLALIGDSTNAVRDGSSPSETEVAQSLAALIKSAPNRVAVTTFASNVGRLRAVAEAARACGREVVVVGRAMERMVQVARETGYFDGVPEFRSLETYGYLPPNKVLALCTGSQGEPRSALSRIARDEHPEITFNRGDRVIFSSRAIPGNEKAVMGVINGLVIQGIEVITDRTHLVHVSGHPRRGELEQMLRWVRPQFITCRDGDMVRLAPDGPAVVDEVPCGRFYKDGALLVDAQARTIPDRRRLAFAGVVSVALAVTEKGELAADPEIELSGIPDTNAKGKAMGDLVAEAITEMLESLPRARRRDPDALAESIFKAVRGTLSRE